MLTFFIFTGEAPVPAGIEVYLESLPASVASDPLSQVTMQENPKVRFVLRAPNDTPTAVYHSTVRAFFDGRSASSDFLLGVCRPGDPGTYGGCKSP
jgi:hypothetical protein